MYPCDPAPTFQWYYNNLAITGATSSSYIISSVTSLNAGNYTVKVSNSYGTVVSNIAAITVNTPPVINTQPTSISVSLGSPASLTVSVSGSDSTYQWYINNTPITGATSSTYNISSVNSSTIGAYTVKISNAAGSIISNIANVSLNTASLVNLSLLGIINTTNPMFTTGFVINGNGLETVLIRAIGPSLTPLGVSGVLTQPQLSLYDSSGNIIATNTAWGSLPVKGSSSLSNNILPVTSAIMSATGAFSLINGSNDCAIIANLPSGQYTSQVTGLNSSTGKVIVEVYQVPTQ